MRADDLSIGYEIWARPNLDLEGLYEQVRAASRLMRTRRWRDFSAVWGTVSGASILGEAKAYVIYQLASGAVDLPGDLIELGVYRGGLSFMLGLMQERTGSSKKVVMCDNFDRGLPAPNRRVDRAYIRGSMTAPIADVRRLRSQLGLGTRCRLKPGLFSKTLPTLPRDQRFSFAHIDCDLYAGTRDALRYVFPRLSTGAPLVVDDYYDESHGVMRAVNEFASRNRLLIHLGIFGQAYVIKGEVPSGVKPRSIDSRPIYLTTDAARTGPLFLDYLRGTLARKAERLERLGRFIDWCERG